MLPAVQQGGVIVSEKALVVVESPAKAKTIEKFLGKSYIVRASMGHLRDLPKSQFGVDIERGFDPKYINIRGKGDIIKELKETARNASRVFLATDPDREGEAIAWHLAYLLNIPPEQPCRIQFNEITKPAVKNAIKEPRPIDLAKVDAQQTRRILDRIVGYKLSPLLWKKVRKGLSAGRVQSVAVRLIVDREKEIQAFKQEEYWTITAKVREKGSQRYFDAELITIAGKKPDLKSETEALDIKTKLEKEDFRVTEVKHRDRRRNAPPPFTTSSLQQDASRKLGFHARKTMQIAQQLYEGLDLGEHGHVGLITYMRTDSTRIATVAQNEARILISQQYSERYLPEKPPIFGNKNAQDAHEAIRPTNVFLKPGDIAQYLTRDQQKLYGLIWSRFIASQMAPAVFDTMAVDINAGPFGLRATGSVLRFDGFLAVYNETEEQEKDIALPELQAGEELRLGKVIPQQHFTQPPPRYTEASLIKALEEKGIGRPSTYAPIIDTIIDRGYVILQEKKFRPTELGIVVVDLLKEYFPGIVDVEFTATMENRLDEIAEGETSRLEVLEGFYRPFAEELSYAENAISHVSLPAEVSDVQCEVCGRFMVVKQGRYGAFLACPGYPECKNTKPLVKETGVHCPICQGQVVERRTKKGRTFYGCQNYPQCNFTTWDQPTKEQCPVCGAFRVKHRFKNGKVLIRCVREDCPSRTAESAETKAKISKRASLGAAK